MKAGRKKLFSFLLAFVMTTNYLPYTTVFAQDTVVEETVDEAAVLDLYNQLMEAETAQKMYAILENASEAVQKALTTDQLSSLIDKVNNFEDDGLGYKSGLLSSFSGSTDIEETGIVDDWIKNQINKLLENFQVRTETCSTRSNQVAVSTIIDASKAASFLQDLKKLGISYTLRLDGTDGEFQTGDSKSIIVEANKQYALQVKHKLIKKDEWTTIAYLTFDITYPATVNTVIDGETKMIATGSFHVNDSTNSGNLKFTPETKEGYTFEVTSDKGEAVAQSDGSYIVTGNVYDAITVTVNYAKIPSYAEVTTEGHVKSVTINGQDGSRYKLLVGEDTGMRVTLEDGYTLESCVWSYYADFNEFEDLTCTPQPDGTWNVIIDDETAGYNTTIYIKVTAVKKDRQEASLKLKSGISLLYDEKVVLDGDIYDSVIESLTDQSGNTIDYKESEFTFTYDRTVGTRSVKVTWTPTGELADVYKPASATVDVAFTKGSSYVSINSQTINYGEKLSDLIKTDPEECKAIAFIANDEFADVVLEGITLNDLSETGDDTKLKDLLGEDVTLSEVKNTFNADTSIKAVISEDALDNINTVIDQILSIYPDAKNVQVSFDTDPSAVGIYSVWGATVNSNYESRIGTGSINIKSAKAATETLSFNNKIGGFILLYQAKQKDYFAYTYTGKDQTKVKEIIMKDGKRVDSITDELGTYTQTVYTTDGSADMITRTFIIKENQSKVTITGTYNGEYDGKSHGIEDSIKITDFNTKEEVKYDPKDLTIHYYGTGGTVYDSAIAPVNAGTYYAEVSFKGNDSYLPSSPVHSGTITIKKVTASITINDVYDGYFDLNSHPVTVQVKDAKGNVIDGAYCDVAYTNKATGKTISGLPVDAGEYLVTVTYKGDDNHEASTNTAVIKIKMITTNFTYKIKDKSAVYGDALSAKDITTTLTAEDPEQVTKEILSLVKSYLDEGLTWSAAPTVGTYKITTNGEVSEDIWSNFSGKINTAAGTLTVTKRPITLKVTGTKKYGEKDPAYTVSIASGSLAYNDTLASLGTIIRKAGESAGSYGFEMKDANKNYDVEFSSDSVFVITGKTTPGSSPSTKKTAGSTVDTGDTSNLIAPTITLMVFAIAVVLLIKKRRSAE